MSPWAEISRIEPRSVEAVASAEDGFGRADLAEGDGGADEGQLPAGRALQGAGGPGRFAGAPV